MYTTSDTTEEALQAAYIKLHGERMSETVALTWMDDGHIDNREVALFIALRKALDEHLTDLELAELASRCVQGPTFAEFCEGE